MTTVDFEQWEKEIVYSQVGSVYLIHFEFPFKHAGHYSGFTRKFWGRINHHRMGTGSNLLRHVNNVGIRWRVVKVWKDVTRQQEHKLKNHGAARYCPVCRGELLVCFDCGKLYKTKRWFNWHKEHKHGN